MKKYYFSIDIISRETSYTFFSTERQNVFPNLYCIVGDRIGNPNGIDIGSIDNNPDLKKEFNSFKIKERISKLNKVCCI